MRRKIADKLIRMGLEYIPTDGLQRLVTHIEQGKPVLMNGAVYSKHTGEC